MAGPPNVCSGDFRVQRLVKCALWRPGAILHACVCVCAHVCDGLNPGALDPHSYFDHRTPNFFDVTSGDST